MASHQAELLQQNENNVETFKSLKFTHIMTWLCVTLDLGIMPLFSMGIWIIFILLPTEPCSCHGYTTEQSTEMSNIGACDCFLMEWSENAENCGYGQDDSIAQFCSNSLRGLFIAMWFLMVVFFLQYQVCCVSWLLVLLCALGLVLWAVFMSFVTCICWGVNVNIEDQLCESLKNIWKDCFEIFRDNVFKNLIWEPFSPQTKPYWGACDWGAMCVIMSCRIANFFGVVFLLIFICVVPITDHSLDAFNCDKYGTQPNGDRYQLRINSIWNGMLKGNLLLILIIVLIVLNTFLLCSRRIIITLIRKNVPNFNSNQQELFYLRVIGYTKKKK
eukprot:98104_1